MARNEPITLDDVYRKFGYTAEAAQLLETELGTALIAAQCAEADLLRNPDTEIGRAIWDGANRKTLGQLVRWWKENGRISRLPKDDENIELLLEQALEARNRLFHSFYRHHNFRRNSETGRVIMLADLESIHETIFRAYKALLLMSGIDLDSPDLQSIPLPTRRLPI